MVLPYELLTLKNKSSWIELKLTNASESEISVCKKYWLKKWGSIKIQLKLYFGPVVLVGDFLKLAKILPLNSLENVTFFEVVFLSCCCFLFYPWICPANIYLFKVNNRNSRKKKWNMLKVDVLVFLSLSIFHTFFSVSIVDFEQVNISCVFIPQLS